ncbi:TetR/AcrR family transcriptional regulator [Anaerocolumna xylanovorans]|uniref:Transcriptional regulator, TetR family n=1 Tax=Anaerocolumna xylanovorans DSM 12503 TaxID=1121345 RepID=A0A1M7Y6T3_9FIRM|nr:TetR family transcriptional regulator [Anaerocolumna xylanovorans]SHO48353.1 transcriptional regulator, TetR family [Anaerocolumna xylanovorans DSM 12503]
MKPQTKRKKQAIETKEKIFNCAVALFAQNSYENITVGDICRGAQVSVGAFYHHFKNKESILNEGYHLFDLQLEETWSQHHPANELEAIRFLVAYQMQSMQQMGSLASSQYFKNQLTNEEKYILNKERFFYKTIYEMVQRSVNGGSLFGDAYIITEDILSTCRGIIYDWCLHEGSYDLSEKGRRTLDMVLNHYGK